MSNDIYNTYRILRKRFRIRYRGFRLEEILTFQIWLWLRDRVYNTHYEKDYERALDLSFLEGNNSDFVMFYDIDREDHRLTFHNISTYVKDHYNVIDKAYSLKCKKYVSKRNKYYAIIRTKIALCGIDFPEEMKKAIAAHFCLILNTIDNLKNLNIKPVRRYVAYSAVHPWENLIGQYYQLYGGEFYGLSHGCLPKFTKNIPIDCINYENLNVDKCLVWGQMTKDAYISYGIPEQKLAVAGYAKKADIREIKSKNDMKKCFVLLARVEFDNSNRHLLKLLSSLSDEYSFCIKLHPSLDFDSYREIADESAFHIIDKSVMLLDCIDIDKYDFAIAVNSTTYYESLIYGLPCLRFEDANAYDLMYSKIDDSFSNKKEFIRAIDFIKSGIEDGTYDVLRREFIEYAVGINTNKYREILLA